MTVLSLNRPEKNEIVKKMQRYFEEELEIEVGQFDAQFLLDFIAAEVGPYFYNMGNRDAQVMMQKRVDDIIESIDALKKPVPVLRKTDK